MFIDVPQNTEEWNALRCGKVTASNFGLFMANYGKAFGEPAKKYALQVALERINGIKSEIGFSNQHTERGHEQEPIARMLYENRYFVDVTNGGFFDLGRYGDSPDGLVDDDGVIEIKSVLPHVHYANITRRSFDPSYKWQLIGHLECTNKEWVDFVSYCSEFPRNSQLCVYRLNKNDYVDEISKLAERRDEFISLVNQYERDISANQ